MDNENTQNNNRLSDDEEFKKTVGNTSLARIAFSKSITLKKAVKGAWDKTKETRPEESAKAIFAVMHITLTKAIVNTLAEAGLFGQMDFIMGIIGLVLKDTVSEEEFAELSKED